VFCGQPINPLIINFSLVQLFLLYDINYFLCFPMVPCCLLLVLLTIGKYVLNCHWQIYLFGFLVSSLNLDCWLTRNQLDFGSSTSISINSLLYSILYLFSLWAGSSATPSTEVHGLFPHHWQVPVAFFHLWRVACRDLLGECLLLCLQMMKIY
jgi:hypothetical protein